MRFCFAFFCSTTIALATGLTASCHQRTATAQSSAVASDLNPAPPGTQFHFTCKINNFGQGTEVIVVKNGSDSHLREYPEKGIRLDVRVYDGQIMVLLSNKAADGTLSSLSKSATSMNNSNLVVQFSPYRLAIDCLNSL